MGRNKKDNFEEEEDFGYHVTGCPVNRGFIFNCRCETIKIQNEYIKNNSHQPDFEFYSKDFR